MADERGEKTVKHEYCYEGGIKSFVEYLNRNKTPLIEQTIYMAAEKDFYKVEVAMQYNESYNREYPFLCQQHRNSRGRHA